LRNGGAPTIISIASTFIPGRVSTASVTSNYLDEKQKEYLGSHRELGREWLGVEKDDAGATECYVGVWGTLQAL